MVLLLATLAMARAQAQQGDVTIANITPSGVKTPIYQVSNIPQKRTPNLTWLEIEVQFATVPPMIDELTFEYTVVMNNQIYTGSVTHVNIEKGAEHYSVAYVSPQTISAAMQGRTFTANSIQNIEIRVLKQGQVLATKDLKSGGIPNLPRQAGMVLNKLDTPFAPLFWDRYEAFKTTPH
jgi:hypothetical protein